MRVNMLSPSPGAKLAGGLKVLHKYANGLAARGHDLRLIHSPFREPGARLGVNARADLRYLLGLVGILPWRPGMEVPGANLHWVRRLTAARVPPADITLGSFWHTTEIMRALPPEVGRCVYLVQEYEYIMTASPGARADGG